jgi:hypothetical protein
MAANASVKSKRVDINANITTNVKDMLSGIKGTDTADWILMKMAGMKPTDVLTIEKRKSLMKCAMSYAGAFIGLILSSITIYIASTDDKALTEGFFKYMFLIIVPIIVGCALILPIFNQRISMKTLLTNGFILFVFILAMYNYQQTKNPASVKFMRYATYGIAFLSVIVGLAIGFRVFYRYINSSQGLVAVVFQILFYIPCLLLELIEYIKYEIGIAPKTVSVLFAIEAVLITLYFVIEPLYNWVYSKVMPKPSDNLIMKDPMFLNIESTIANSTLLSTNTTKDDNGLSTFSYRANYTVSFWANLNHTKDTNENPILCLGQKDELGGKPLITYSGGKGNYRMYLTNQLEADIPQPQLEMHLPLQKWNHFVFSYDGNNVHIFINGDLVKTYKFDNINRPTYSIGDTIITGMTPGNPIRNAPSNQLPNTLGASGSICHVRYHTRPITQREVITEYNMYMYSNPPVPFR